MEKKRQIIYNGEQLTKVHVLSVKINETATITREPIEDGTPMADHKVRNPITASVSVMVEGKDWGEVESQLTKMYNDKLSAGKVTIDTTSHTYDNMALVSRSHEENGSDKFDNYYFDLEFQQVLWTESSVSNVPVKYANSVTKKTGEAGASNGNG